MVRNVNLLAALVAAAAAHAKIIPIRAVNVAFDPPVVTAQPGDTLEYHFAPSNHSVVMGDVNHPCQPATSGGFYSGFWPVNAGEAAEVFRVLVNDTNPIVFYCSQAAGGHNHCQAGMAGVVNADNATLQAYIAGAKAINQTVSPAAVFGGVLATNANATGNGTASATGSASPTASPSHTTVPLSAAGRAFAVDGGVAVLATLLLVVVML